MTQWAATTGKAAEQGKPVCEELCVMSASIATSIDSTIVIMIIISCCSGSGTSTHRLRGVSGDVGRDVDAHMVGSDLDEGRPVHAVLNLQPHLSATSGLVVADAGWHQHFVLRTRCVCVRACASA